MLRLGFALTSVQIGTLFTLPLVTRAFGTSAYGEWVLLLSLALILGILLTLRLELAVVLPQSDFLAMHTMIVGAAIATSAGAFLGIAGWVIGSVSPLGGRSLLSSWLLVVGLALLVAINALGMAWMVRMGAFGRLSLAHGVLGWVPAVVAVILSTVVGASVSALAAGAIVAYSASSALGWTSFAFDINKKVLPVRHPRIAAAALALRRHRNYPLFMAPYSLVGAIRERLLYLVLSLFSGSSIVGLVAASARIANAPNSLISGILRPITFHHISRNGLDTPFGNATKTVVASIGYFLVTPFAFAMLFAREILGLLLGAEWAAAGPYLTWLLLATLPLTMGNWLDRVFDVKGRQRLALGLELTMTFVAVTVLFVSLLLSNSAVVAVAVQSLALAAYFCLWLLLIFHLAGLGVRSVASILAMTASLMGLSLITLRLLYEISGLWLSFSATLLVSLAALEVARRRLLWVTRDGA